MWKVASSWLCLAVCVTTTCQPDMGVSAFVPALSQRPAKVQLAATLEEPESGEEVYRFAEFKNLEPIRESQARKERLSRDSQAEEKFAKFGDELWDLRSTLERLNQKLVSAISMGQDQRKSNIHTLLYEAEQRDPELVYKRELEELKSAELNDRTEDIALHYENAMEARRCLPQFNLEGLWVGKYGDHGYEMINVTYAGDTLVAYKVTGDKNVPKGEITFQVDLSPLSQRRVGSDARKKDKNLEPIHLSDKASKKWGTTQLQRHRGLGRVAEPGFRNSQWMDGQLIIVGQDYFSFAWVPLEHQVLFGRPSPELCLRMMRNNVALPTSKFQDGGPSMHAELSTLKDYAALLLQKTHETHDEIGEPVGNLLHSDELHFE